VKIGTVKKYVLLGA